MRANIIPTLRYRDGAAAIDWLCRAFGFERHLVVPGENGAIAHAQLTLGNGMIMLGSARNDEFGKLQKTPAQVGLSVRQAGETEGARRKSRPPSGPAKRWCSSRAKPR